MQPRPMAFASSALVGLLSFTSVWAADSLTRSGDMSVVQEPMDGGGTVQCKYTVSKLPIDRVFRVYAAVYWGSRSLSIVESQFSVGGATRSYSEASPNIYSISSKFVKGALVTTIIAKWHGPVQVEVTGDKIYCTLGITDDQGATVYVNDTNYRLSLAAPVGPY